MTDTEKLESAKLLIRQQKYKAARDLLQSMTDDAEARLWLWRVEEKLKNPRFEIYVRPEDPEEYPEERRPFPVTLRGCVNILSIIIAATFFIIVWRFPNGFTDTSNPPAETATFESPTLVPTRYVTPSSPTTPIPTRAATLATLAATVAATADGGAPVSQLDRVDAVVTNIVTPDTFDVSINGGTYRVIFLGIAGPNSGATCYEDAIDFNKRIFGDKTVTLVKDVTEKDGAGRLPRYVYMGDALINSMLVQAGLALPLPNPPNARFDEQFQNVGTQALIQNVGCYAKGGFFKVGSNDPLRAALCDKRSCNDFTSLSEVKLYLAQCPMDLPKFDIDRNGRPCDSNADFGQ